MSPTLTHVTRPPGPPTPTNTDTQAFVAYAPRVMWAGKNATVSIFLDDSDAQFARFSVTLRLVTDPIRFYADTRYVREATGAYSRGRVHAAVPKKDPPTHTVHIVDPKPPTPMSVITGPIRHLPSAYPMALCTFSPYINLCAFLAFWCILPTYN